MLCCYGGAELGTKIIKTIAVLSDPALNVKALESLLVEKGYVDPDGLDALFDRFEHNVGPRNGARVVAQAVKIDPLETEAYVGLAQGLGYAGILDFVRPPSAG